ncbi:MAG: hypothetical protein WC997_08235, partial [Porticoccaceae bacterium]
RYRNLLLLVQEAGNNQAEVARRSDTSPSYINQIIRQLKTPNGTTRSVGTRLARRLEQGFAKPKGWMDEDHRGKSARVSDRSTLSYSPQSLDLTPDEIELVQLAREFSLIEDFLRISRKHKTGLAKESS